MIQYKKIIMTLALLLTAVTGAWADGISVTTEDFGKVICTDGSIYATVEDATAASKTAAAKIFFIDNVNKKGLALALADESGTMDWSTAKTTAAAHTPAVTGGTWKLATMDEWTNMREAAKNYQNDEHKGHSTFKNMANLTQRYWVNTEDEYDSNNAYYYIPYSGGQFGFSTDPKTNNSSCYVRACLEFNIAAPSGPEVAWNKVSKTGTFVMPGSDVELQVEYYPESNLFLGKEAMADKANISVLNGETAVAFDDDGKSTATVTEGNTVTAKFTGKKVLGMKVEKKGAASKLASEVTPDDIFKVIASDGMIYDNIAAAESAGTTAQGLVVYVGSNTGNATYTHGMALALQDEANNTWSGAKDACNAKNTSTPIVGALWIQASKDQWNTMFNAVGGDCKLRDCFSSAGGTNLVKGEYYWSGSSHEDYGEQGDYYCFTGDDWTGDWSSTSVYYNDNYHVRACIVF